MLKQLKGLFDLRAYTPRERRRISHRENAKGVVGQVAGKPRTEAEQGKRAQRRVHRRAMTKAIYDGLLHNPAGSKRLRRYAKAAGYVVVEDDKIRKPTATECARWYEQRMESPILIGAKAKTQEEILAMMAWNAARSAQPATRVMGAS